MFKVVVTWAGGDVEELVELCETREEAEEYGMVALSDRKQGAYVLNMHDPGEYPIPDDMDDDDFEIVEV